MGKGGFKKNYEKAAELYTKLAAQDHKYSLTMLGMCYFKGQGVPLDRKKARVLFEQSTKTSLS
jgi:TPR repeat protein